MKTICIKIATAILVLWYKIARIFPKRKQIAMFSRQSNTTPIDFSLLKTCIEKYHPDYSCVVFAKKIQGMGYVFHMFKQVFYIATSEAVVLDSYCIVVSLLNSRIKVPVLQMWHALGNMKKFGYTALDTPGGHSSKTAKLMHMHEGYTSILCSSFSFVDDISAGFNAQRSKMYEAPLPRVDLLIDNDERQRRRKEIFKTFPELDPEASGKKNIVYCPTFRRDASGKTCTETENRAVASLVEQLDFSRYNFIFKRHPVSSLVIDDARVLQGYDPKFDMLYIADYVISDYSTVIYEAGLLDLPVFLYSYDWQEYRKNLQLYIDIEHDVPTLFSPEPQKIIAAIENDSFDFAAYKRFIDNNITIPEKGTCTKRVEEHLFNLIDAT